GQPSSSSTTPICRSARSRTGSARTAWRSAPISVVAGDASESFWVNTMDELQRRFAALDRVQAPDLWPSIQDRSARLASEPAIERVPRGRLTGARGAPSFRDRPTLVWLVVLALISAVVVGALSVGASRLFSVPG